MDPRDRVGNEIDARPLRRTGLFAVAAVLALVLVAVDFQALRQAGALGLALTALQGVLLIALALLARRELRALAERRASLEALADTLGAARRSAEAESAARAAFLARMGHEIRTPFHGMLGMLTMVQDGGLSAQQTACLDGARESAQHLLTILNDALDPAQLESGQLRVAPQTVDLLRLIAQVDALMRAQAQAKGLALRVEVAPDVPRWVQADPTRLKQILFNLLSQAVQLSARGSVLLSVQTGASGAQRRIDFSVTDSGVCSDAAGPSRDTPATGPAAPPAGADDPGLEISRDLARLMGGRITQLGQPGAGSTVIAALPLASMPAPAPASYPVAAPSGAGFTPLRVLVAEDHPVNRAYLEAVLERLGHRGVFCADGAGAVRAVGACADGDEFDVVLMDLQMPGMDGFSAARAIRALPGPRGRMPIIALTADAFQESRELARAAGMDGFLTKPAHLPQLREALDRHAGRSVKPAPPPVAAAPGASDGGLLDQPTVDDLLQALPARKYAELLGAFFDARGAALAELRQAIATDARRELRERAHALKGASLSLGLRRLGEHADQLQSSAPAAAPDALRQSTDALERAFDASLDECRRRGLVAGAARAAAPPLTPPAAPARA